MHGLNEDLTEAWTDSKTKVLWLRDLLPQTIQDARVVTFGYNAYASSFYGSGSVDRIQQHAHTLIADLQADRALEGCLQRPIIFICHGLGGILVKKLWRTLPPERQNMSNICIQYLYRHSPYYFLVPRTMERIKRTGSFPQIRNIRGSSAERARKASFFQRWKRIRRQCK